MNTYLNKHNRIRRIMCLAACCLCALLVMSQAVTVSGASEKKAVDPVGQSDNFSTVIYNNMNGLPTSEANAIAQTSEGFIWIGSYGGLIRYDGNTFERMDATIGLGSVVSLCVDSFDRLWIGTNESGLAMMEKGEFRFWGEDQGLTGAKVCSIEESSDGIVYVGTTEGLYIVTPEFEIEAIDDPRTAGTYIEHIHSGSDGHMFVTTNEDDFFELKGDKVVNYISHNDAHVSNVTDILPDPDNPGMIYAGTGENILYYTSTVLEEGNLETIDISPLMDVIDIQQIDGKVWICARNGIGMLDEDGFHLLDLPMNNSVTQVMKDYEGDLWFISTRQGVMKVVSNRFSDIFERHSLEETVVNSTCMLDGRLFIGADTGLIVVDDDDRVTEIPLTEAKTASGEDLGETDLIGMLDGNRIRSIIRDSRNRLWISTWRGAGLVCYDNGSVTTYSVDDGLLSDHIRAVYEVSDGSILVANTGGASVIRNGAVVRSYDKEDGIENPEILTVCASPDGDFLLGSNGGGIYVINDKGTRCISTHDGLSSGIIMRIKYDAKRDLYWMVTSNSLAYMTRDYKVTTIREFPYSNNFDLYENSMDDMWVLSSNGIYVVPVEELLRNEEIQPAYYSMANGLPCITTSNSYSELTADGDLYIAGGTGVAKVDINEPMELISDLKQAVPFVDCDGEMYYPDEHGDFYIPSSVQRLTIYAYVYNYSLTDPKVTYRLMGFDRNPVTVNRSDLGPVIYTNLSGGTYRFTMELRDAMGRGSRSTVVQIIKAKKIYEQTWFYILVGVLIAGLVYGLVRIYVARKVQKMEEQHRETAEKERMAHELQMASQIQLGMLPHTFPPFPDRSEFDIYAVMKPAREVGGDFYDFFLVDYDHLCIVMADVSGKGIPAALYMMVSKVMLQSFANLGESASEILSRTNETICADNRSDMFVTVWLGILEISTGRITAANAGHEYPAIRRAGGQYELYKEKHSFVVGGIEDVVYTEYELQLASGDKLFLYTDGVPEATNSENEMFGTGRMIEALNKYNDESPENLLKGVRREVRAFVDKAEQFDDLTMLCLEYKGPRP